MNIQEALKKVQELKADAQKYIKEAEKKRIRTIYLEVEDKYKKESFNIESLIDNAVNCFTEAHKIKLAIQKANVENNIVDLIQEADLLKSLCSAFENFKDTEQETDPTMPLIIRSVQTNTFQKQIANFDTAKMKANYEKWQERIREINTQLQKMNFEVQVNI